MPITDLRYQKKRRDGDSLIQHAENFKIQPRFVTRPWTFNAPFPTAVNNLSLKQRMQLMVELVPYGLSGFELVYHQEINPQNLKEFIKFANDFALKIYGIVIDFASEPGFSPGVLAASEKKVHAQAVSYLKAALEFTEEIEADYALLLLNNEGYNQHFGLDLISARDRFTLSLVEALDNFPEVRLILQAAPVFGYWYPLFPTTAELVLLSQKIEALLSHNHHREQLIAGHTIISILPDLIYLHHLGEESVASTSLLLETGRLAGIGLNYFANNPGLTPLPNLESDFLKSIFYLLKLTGFKETIHLNVSNAPHTPAPVLKNLMDGVRAWLTFVNYLDDDKIILSQQAPEKNQGWLEAYLLRATAPHGKTLPPMAFFQL
ncbi:hypothetical protein L0128_10885 [candidate division KSB1 bacterium]|nr:hypothetical protein [candidate division KSB1 bacterium]